MPRERLKRVHLPIVPALRELAGAGGDGGGGGGVVQGPGRVLTRVHVKPIFWGSEWYRRFVPTVGDIRWAIQTIFLGPYMDGLSQYGVGNGWLDPNSIFTGLTIDPPNPFSEPQLRKLLTDLIDWPASAGSLPDPAGDLADLPTDPQMLPVIFTPLNVGFVDENANGFNDFMTHNGTTFPYVWVKNIGDLEFLSAVSLTNLRKSAPIRSRTGWKALRVHAARMGPAKSPIIATVTRPDEAVVSSVGLRSARTGPFVTTVVFSLKNTTSRVSHPEMLR